MKASLSAVLLAFSACTTESRTMSTKANDRKRFLDAMDPDNSGSNHAGSIRAERDFSLKGLFFQRIMSQAQHIGGRDLATTDDWGDFGFDITQYSVKYAGCSTMKSYSDDLASNAYATTVLTANRFVIFRLCPTSYCNKFTVTGCTLDFGEYAIMMDTYLAAIQKYNDDKKENFCNYCSGCLAGSSSNTTSNATDDQVACSAEDADTCSDASVTCAGDDQSTLFEQYFECKDKEFGNDNTKVYVAPHCNSDGFNITLGIYSDAQCSNYTGDQYTIEEVTGVAFDHSEINTYFPKECVSCAEQSNVWDNAAVDNSDNNKVSEVCETLYSSSAKCNKNYYAVQEASYNSQQQSDNSAMVCNFIGNLLSGSYDESGEIVIDANSWVFNSSNWRSQGEYRKQYNSLRVTGGQIAGIVITALACVVMWVWACCLHGSLSKRNISWRPRRGKHAYDDDLTRQSSGILMGRSRSGPNGPIL